MHNRALLQTNLMFCRVATWALCSECDLACFWSCIYTECKRICSSAMSIHLQL